MRHIKTTHSMLIFIVLMISGGAQASTPWASGSSSSATAQVGAIVLPPFAVGKTRASAVMVPSLAPIDQAGVGITGDHGNRLIFLNQYGEGLTTITIAGEPNTAFSLSLPQQQRISVSNGKEALLLHSELKLPLKVEQLDASGRQTLTINAILSARNNEMIEGRYRGHFPVTVEHN